MGSLCTKSETTSDHITSENYPEETYEKKVNKLQQNQYDKYREERRQLLGGHLVLKKNLKLNRLT